MHVGQCTHDTHNRVKNGGDMNEVFEQFGKLLETRLEHKVQTTEDSVRYTFFAALLDKTELNPHQVIQEFSHPNINLAEVDTWIPELSGETVAIEFKYDREIPSGKNAPKTQKAGKLFHDLSRLLEIVHDGPIKRIFVYLTSNEMVKYMKNPMNGLADFFSLEQGKGLVIDDEFITSKAKTFRDEVGSPFNARLVSLWKQSLPKDHELRVYEVRSQKS